MNSQESSFSLFLTGFSVPAEKLAAYLARDEEASKIGVRELVAMSVISGMASPDSVLDYGRTVQNIVEAANDDNYSVQDLLGFAPLHFI